MATHMFRQLRRSSAVLNLVRRQNIRLVSSCGPRMIFAARRYDQQPYLLQSSVFARPAVLGLRMFADASPNLSVEDRVLNVVKLFEVDPEKVTLESHFINDLGLDSLDVVEIVMAFEDEFVINISDEEAEKIFTVADAVEFVKKALEAH